MWQPLITDLNGTTRAILRNWQSLSITQRLNSYASATVELPTLATSSAEVAIANRALKIYEAGDLRMFGQIWEPLGISAQQVTIEARDPLALLAWRRVKGLVTYTATDAGAIVSARVAAQNARRNTFLRMGTVQTSVSRDRTYQEGKREDELIHELSEAYQGFNYRATPVDSVAGVFADLQIYYPAAGTTRLDTRFEYGADTLDNLEDFRVVYSLPRNRIVVSSGGTTANDRIFASAQNQDSINEYGHFEDETSYSDVTRLATLQEHANGLIRPLPPLAIEITPADNAPMLFHDFVCGDFVRVFIRHGPLNLQVWARVQEATIRVDRNGVVRLSNIVVDTLEAPAERPEEVFRNLVDDYRRRIEALERKAASPTLTDPGDTSTPNQTAPGTPTPSDAPLDPQFTAPPPSGETPPAEPTAPPPPPPPAPPAVPSLSGFSVWAVSSREAVGSVDVEPNGADTWVWFTYSNAEGIGSSGRNVQHLMGGLTPGATYQFKAYAENAGGRVEAGPISLKMPNFE